MSRKAQVSLLAIVIACLTTAGALASSIGSQTRISQVGPDGNPNFDGLAPAVAYNPQANQYLAVWEGDDVTDDETEIYGRLLDGTGAPAGPEFRISQVGPEGDPNFDAFRPAVAYASQTNEYLVVWHANAGAGNQFEIYGQRVSAAGTEVGPNDFRISDAGPDGDRSFDAFKPVTAYDPDTNEYMVVWYGDDTVDDEFEIYGQRISAAGAETGPNDFRISDMGPDGNKAFLAQRPSIAYSQQAHEYLVVWDGDDVVDNETEVYGQRLGPGGAEVGPNDFRISDAGPDGDTRFDAVRPAVEAGRGNDYLVVWYANETPRNQFEIYGQRVSTAGIPIGENDFLISKLGNGGSSASLDAQFPALAYGERTNEYLAVWSADDGTPPLVDDEFEIFTRRAQAGASARDAAPALPTGKPRLTLQYRKRQRIATKRGVVLYAVTDQSAKLFATARLSRAHSSKKGGIRRAVKANHRYRLRFKLSKKVRRAVKRNLRRHKRVIVRVRVRVTNATGLSTTVRAKIRARR